MKKTKQKIKYTKSDTISGWLFCSVWIVGFLAFTLYPLIQTIIFSFSEVSDGVNTTPVGLANYIFALARDTDFLDALSAYAMKTIMYVPIITVFSLILAMLLNSKLKGTGVFRTIFFLPVIITSGPVIEIFISQGVAAFPGIETLININELSGVLPQFLLDAISFLTSEFIMILWFSGIQILVFMTGLQKMDKSMYEAAQIDGASKWEIFWKITLPALNPIIILNIVFTVVMQSVFSLNPVIQKIQQDMYATGEGAGTGYASAMAWIYFFVMAALLGLFVLLFMKKKRRAR